MYVGVWFRFAALFCLYFALGCSEAIPQVSSLTSVFMNTTVEGVTDVTISISNAGSTVAIKGQCSILSTGVELSYDNGTTWQTPPTNGSYDFDCSDSHFSFEFTDTSVAPIAFVANTFANFNFLVRTKNLITTSNNVAVTIEYANNVGPAVALNNVPTNPSAATSLAVDVLNHATVPQYKYKVGALTSTDCHISAGYSSATVNAVSTDLVSSLSSMVDGYLKLCVVGFDGTTWQPYAFATQYSWFKDLSTRSVKLSSSTTSVTEGDGYASIQIELSSAPLYATSVEYKTDDGTALSGSDYTNTYTVANFAVGETVKSVTIPVSDDAILEPSENFTVTLQNPGFGVTLGSPVVNTVTIADNEIPPTLGLAVASSTVSEFVGGYAIAVNLSQAHYQPVTVDYSFVDVTTAGASDYTASAGSLTFAAGETTKTVGLTVINDSNPEATESVKIVLANFSANVTPAITELTLTILDDDITPFMWSGAGPNANWNTASNWQGGVVPGAADTAIFNSFCSSNCSANLTANTTVGGITMSAGYAGTVNQGNYTLSLGARDLVIAGGTFQGGTAALTVRDFTQTGGSFIGGAGNFIVTRNWSVTGGATALGSTLVEFNGTANGTVQSTNAFGPVKLNKSTIYSLIFTSSTQILGALEVVNSGTYTGGGFSMRVNGNITLTGCSNTSTLSLTTTGIQNLTSSGACGLSDLIIDSGAGVVTATGTIIVKKDLSYLSGTYIAGTSTLNLTSASSSVVNAAGGNLDLFNLVITKSVSSSVTFNGVTVVIGSLTLNSTSGGRLLNGGTGRLDVYGDITATSALLGGDLLIRAVGGMSGQTFSGSGLLPSLEIAMSAGGNFTLSQDLRIAKDFTITSGTVNAFPFAIEFATGSPAADSNVSVGAFEFSHLHVSKTGTTGVNFTTPAVVKDNFLILSSATSTQVLKTGVLKLQGYVANESSTAGGGNAALTFEGTSNQTWLATNPTAGRWPRGTVTINKSAGQISLQSDIVLNGATQDLALTSGAIDINGYNLNIPDVLSSAAGTKIIRSCGFLTYGSHAPALATIISGREVSLSIADAAAVVEGASASFVVTSAPANCEATVFSWVTGAGTVSFGNDLLNQGVSGLSIAANSSTTTINVSTIDDTIYEGSTEYFTVGLSSSHTGATITDATALGYINDNETLPVVDFSSASGSVAENIAGGVYTYTIQLNHASYQDVTFEVFSSNSTAISPDDFTAFTTNGTILAGNTQATFTVAIINDNLYDGVDRFNLFLNNEVNASLGGGFQQVTINDDESLPTVSFATNNAEAFEDLTFTDQPSLVLSVGADSPVVVPITFNSGVNVATYASDFNYNGGTSSVTVPAAATSYTIPVTIDNSSSIEPDESVQFMIPASGANWTQGTPSVFTLTIYDKDLGSFNIDGVGSEAFGLGHQDDIYNNVLEYSPYPQVKWQRSAGAVTYTLTIVDLSYSMLCQVQLIPDPGFGDVTYLLSASDGAGCAMQLNQSYMIRVESVRAGGAGVAGNNYMTFTVNSNSRYREPVYTTLQQEGWWGRLLSNNSVSKDPYLATGAICNFGSTNGYGGCFHAGEKKQFVLTNIAGSYGITSCADIKFTDYLGRFNWRCETFGADLVIRMTGLKDIAAGNGLSYIMDFDSGLVNKFIANRIEVRKVSDNTMIFKSADEKWWNNPFTQVTGSMSMDNANPGVNPNPIFYARTPITFSTGGNIAIRTSSVNFVVRPTDVILSGSSTNNCHPTYGDPDAGVGTKCTLIVAKYNSGVNQALNEIWVEGSFSTYNPSLESARAVMMVNVGFSQFKNLRVQQAGIGVHLTGVHDSYFNRFKLASFGTEGLLLNSNNVRNLFSEFVISEVDDIGLRIGVTTPASSSNVFMRGVLSTTGTGSNALGAIDLGLYGASRNVFSHMVVASSGYTAPGAYIKTDATSVLDNLVFNNIVTAGATSGYHYNLQNSGTPVVHLSNLVSYNPNKIVITDYPRFMASNLGGVIPLSAFNSKSKFLYKDNAWTGTCSNIVSATDTNCSSVIGSYGAPLFTTNITDDFVGTGSSVAIASITDWINIGTSFSTSFVAANDIYSTTPQSACTTGNCYIYDWRLKSTSDVLYNRTGTGTSITDNNWSAGFGCPLAVNGDRKIVTSTQKFLINAIEILGDSVGDEDGLCEKDEACLFTPHFGAFQGATSSSAQYEKCLYNSVGDPDMTGISMYRHVSLY